MPCCFIFFCNEKCWHEEEYIDIHIVKIAVPKYVNVGSDKFETNAMLKWCIISRFVWPLGIFSRFGFSTKDGSFSEWYLVRNKENTL